MKKRDLRLLLAILLLIGGVIQMNYAPESSKLLQVLSPSPVIKPTAVLGEKTSSGKEPAQVVKVVDGDTIRVSLNNKEETIRMIGLNTPESVDPRRAVECFGKEASNQLKSLLDGKTVYLEADETQGERDKYSRLLRFVWLDEQTNINKQMIADGYAYEYTYDLPYKYQEEFKAAQEEAQAAKKGLWAADTCGGEK